MRLLPVTALLLLIAGCSAAAPTRAPVVAQPPASPTADAASKVQAQAAADTCAASKAAVDDAKVIQIAAGLASATGVAGQLYLDVRKHSDANVRYLADNNTSMAFGNAPGDPPTADQQAATGRLDQDLIELKIAQSHIDSDCAALQPSSPPG